MQATRSFLTLNSWFFSSLRGILKTFFVLQLHFLFYTPHILLLCGRILVLALSSPICISCEIEDLFLLFDSPVATLRLFFSQVVLSIQSLPTLKLPSSRSLIHNNDSHIVRFLQSLKLCCLDAKPQCYLLCASA